MRSFVGLFWNPPEPAWVGEFRRSFARLHRKVDYMALDAELVGRILAGAGALAEQARASAERETALKAQLDQALSERDSERAAEAAEDASDAEANQQLLDLANAVDTLVKGPETPAVVVPTPEEAVAVVEGDSPVETPSGDPVSDTPEATEQVV